MTQKNNNTISGTIEQNDSNSSKSKDIVKSMVSYRDIGLVVGFILALHLFGIISIPFIDRFSGKVFGDVIVTVISTIALTYATVWQRFKKVIDEIYTKEWEYIGYVDAKGKGFGSWKTDPDTLDRFNDSVDVEGAEDLNQYRDGIDVNGRRYALVNKIERNTDDSDKTDWILRNIDTYPVKIGEDRVIANKEHLAQIIENLLDDADFGRKAKLSLKPRLKSYINKLSSQLSVIHQKAVNEGFSDPEELFEESIKGYERLEIDTEDLGQDLTDDMADEMKDEIISEIEEEDIKDNSQNININE